jgi:short-subunit dehydrogenase
MRYFQNKTILITGASSGIGAEMARQLSRLNCRLFLTARRTELLEQLASELKNSKAEINSFRMDVSDKSSCLETINTILQISGGIDIAILNAGASVRNTLDSFDISAAENIVKTNLLGVMYGMHGLIPSMLKQGGGVIAAVSSLADSRGLPKSSVYIASKAGLTAFLEAARIELMPHNIRVLIVKPGFVTSPMTDKNEFNMPFIMPAEKGARLILEGISKEKRIIQFPLPLIIATRMLKFLPGFLYEFIAKRAVDVAGLKKK